MIKNLISVTIPVYNGEQYILRAINSLLQQSYENWECIIVDDGSTDSTKEILKTLTDKRFKVFYFEKNKGRPFARQKALDECKGEFYAMLDADDFYAPSKLEEQIKILNENSNISLVSCRMCSFGINKDFIRIRPTDHETSFDLIKKYNQKEKYPTPHAPSVLRTELAKKITYNTEMKYGEDMFYLREYLSSHPYYYILSNVLYYYSEFDSVTISDIKLSLKNRIKVTKNILTKMNLIFKYVFTTLLLPMLGIDWHLKRRGQKTTSIVSENFKLLLNKYSK